MSAGVVNKIRLAVMVSESALSQESDQFCCRRYAKPVTQMGKSALHGAHGDV
jgi:hypothetical protein